MPDFATLVAFSLTALAVVVSPGPDSMLIVRYGVTSGPRAAFAAVAGVQIGLIVHTLLAVAGISALIAASPALFRTLAIAGAGYLGWLGIEGLRATATFAVDSPSPSSRPPVPARRACRDAVLTNLLNPKVILLFVALYPNFVTLGRGDVTSQLLALSAILIVINVLWQAPLAWAAKSVRRWLGRPPVQRLVSRLTGAILLVFAVLILFEHAA
jgi:homoserine/homoserine lactone efflux protein